MLPPRSDFHRRRIIAGRMLIALGMIHGVPILFELYAVGTGGALPICLVFGVPIVTYTVLGMLIQNRRFWALVAAIAITSMESLVPLWLIATLIRLAVQFGYDQWWFVALSVVVAIELILITTLLLLARCFAAFRDDRAQQAVGFAPIIIPRSVLSIDES